MWGPGIFVAEVAKGILHTTAGSPPSSDGVTPVGQWAFHHLPGITRKTYQGPAVECTRESVSSAGRCPSSDISRCSGEGRWGPAGPVSPTKLRRGGGVSAEPSPPTIHSAVREEASCVEAARFFVSSKTAHREKGPNPAPPPQCQVYRSENYHLFPTDRPITAKRENEVGVVHKFRIGSSWGDFVSDGADRPPKGQRGNPSRCYRSPRNQRKEPTFHMESYRRHFVRSVKRGAGARLIYETCLIISLTLFPP